jgi:hypothetical protein
MEFGYKSRKCFYKHLIIRDCANSTRVLHKLNVFVCVLLRRMRQFYTAKVGHCGQNSIIQHMTTVLHVALVGTF